MRALFYRLTIEESLYDDRAPTLTDPRGAWAAFRLSTQSDAAQAQAVGDDRDRGERHRRAREDGRQRPARERVERARRQWDADRVVDERPEKILPDDAHRPARELDGRHDASQAPADERHVRGLDRHVGARPDRDAYVGLRQRGRVVDAV